MDDMALETDPVCETRPRARILARARELFHRHGIRSVGVEAIAEAAGTNKMTLYRHFSSKDELVCQCLREVAAEIGCLWDDLAAAHPDDTRAQLGAWVETVAARIIADGRGCELANAAIELAEAGHPARRLIEEVKTANRDRLAALCAAAGARQPDDLADALYLLLEGARVCRQSVGAEGPSARFVRSAETLIAAFTGHAAA